MTSAEIRQKFLDFFKSKDHAIVKSSSLIPDDPSVLLTTAGMQQFKKYYTGELDAMKDFGSTNTASAQKSFRTSDIDEVGDERHLTFFEMLGNFSFGGYFKKEAIQYAHEFITKEMGLAISYVTVFKGMPEIGVPKDEESISLWNSLGVNDVREEGMSDVFWGPTGSEGPCGPTTEIYVQNGAGQDIEVWNIVFNQYFFPGSRDELESGASGKKLEPLKTPGVDTGMGLERLTMCVQKTEDIFDTDLFTPIISKLAPDLDVRIKRVIADHVRALAFLIADGVRPSNKGAGYILRRLMRRVIAYAYRENIGAPPEALLETIASEYGSFYDLDSQVIQNVYTEEYQKFIKTITAGNKELSRIIESYSLDSDYGELARQIFNMYQSQGLPIEVALDEFANKRANIDVQKLRRAFESEFKKHQEVSKAGSEAKFGGHGLYLKTGEVTIRDESEVEKVTRLHTATHLLHAGLRAVLGPEVQQDGSDITVERTRFDFRFPRKVTSKELKKVEDWVNDAVKKDLKIESREMSFEDATKEGALGFFRERYPERVKVYTVQDASGAVYSKELCGGPHVEHTATIGTFRITKEESSSAGVRRIRGIIEP